MKVLAHYDAIGELRVTKTPEGFLKGDVIVTRTGIFTYMRADGKVVKELRHPADVFDDASLASMKMIPIVIDHPPPDPANGNSRLVTAENSAKLSVGMTGESHRIVAGNKVAIPVSITHADAVKVVESGKNQVSLGYTAMMDETSGLFEGQRYDMAQKEIRYNHLAIVDTARAGPEARIRMDSGMVLIDDQQEILKMKKVKLDGIEYDAAPEVANALARATEQVSELTAQAAKDKEAITTATAKADAADKKLKETMDGIPAMVKRRTELVAAATSVLGKEAKLDASDRDLMTAVIVKVMPDTKLDGKSDEYVSARFDAAVELCDSLGDAEKRKKLGLPAATTGARAEKSDSELAQERHRRRLENGGKDPEQKKE